jgi:transketolase C-terminal domain/subunit
MEDRFGESGRPWELMIRFGLTAEHIAAKAKVLVRAGKGTQQDS